MGRWGKWRYRLVKRGVEVAWQRMLRTNPTRCMRCTGQEPPQCCGHETNTELNDGYEDRQWCLLISGFSIPNGAKVHSHRRANWCQGSMERTVLPLIGSRSWGIVSFAFAAFPVSIFRVWLHGFMKSLDSSRGFLLAAFFSLLPPKTLSPQKPYIFSARF